MSAKANKVVIMHMSRPRRRLDVAILYLTRVFAIQIDEKNLLVEYFACHGFVGVDTDIFHSRPARKDISQPGFDT